MDAVAITRAAPNGLASCTTRDPTPPAPDTVWADRVLPAGLPVQGNLDPLVLIAGGDALDRSVDGILAAFSGRPHIFNLGHGITPETPIAHVERMLARVRRG